MAPHPPLEIRRIGPGEVASMHDMLDLFGQAFEEPDTFGAARPDADYFERLLANDHFIALAAFREGEMIGALAGYELPKYEKARSEIYIYDLAVAEAHRRRGVATALIDEVRAIARACGAWMVFVQADYVDPPAIALYSKLGTREDVLHFDIAP